MDEFNLLLELNRVHRNDSAEKVVKELITLDDKDMLTSGDDSGLKNVWEEICVQVKSEKSIHWDSYENTIENCISSELELQPKAIVDLLIYIGNIHEPDEVLNRNGAINDLLSDIWSKANLYTNINIEKYLNGEFSGEDDEEGKEDDEDDESEAIFRD